ncbi:hypothetical protein TSOC_014422, partial [Tetrabaena socialis]
MGAYSGDPGEPDHAASAPDVRGTRMHAAIKFMRSWLRPPSPHVRSTALSYACAASVSSVKKPVASGGLRHPDGRGRGAVRARSCRRSGRSPPGNATPDLSGSTLVNAAATVTSVAAASGPPTALQQHPQQHPQQHIAGVSAAGSAAAVPPPTTFPGVEVQPGGTARPSTDDEVGGSLFQRRAQLPPRRALPTPAPLKLLLSRTESDSLTPPVERRSHSAGRDGDGGSGGAVGSPGLCGPGALWGSGGGGHPPRALHAVVRLHPHAHAAGHAGGAAGAARGGCMPRLLRLLRHHGEGGAGAARRGGRGRGPQAARPPPASSSGSDPSYGSTSVAGAHADGGEGSDSSDSTSAASSCSSSTSWRVRGGGHRAAPHVGGTLKRGALAALCGLGGTASTAKRRGGRLGCNPWSVEAVSYELTAAYGTDEPYGELLLGLLRGERALARALRRAARSALAGRLLEVTVQLGDGGGALGEGGGNPLAGLLYVQIQTCLLPPAPGAAAQPPSQPGLRIAHLPAPPPAAAAATAAVPPAAGPCVLFEAPLSPAAAAGRALEGVKALAAEVAAALITVVDYTSGAVLYQNHNSLQYMVRAGA